MVLVNERVEALIDGLSDHLSPGNKFGIQLVEDVLEVVSLYTFLGIKQLQELLYELGSHIDFETLYICCLVDNELKEELVDTL